MINFGTAVRTNSGVGPAFALLVIFSAVSGAVAFSALLPALPAISTHFASVPNAPALTRCLATAVGLAMAVGAPLAGFAVELFGLRKVLLVSASIFTISGLAGFSLDNLWALLASRVLVGLSEAALSATDIALIAGRLEPARRDRWIGLFTFWGVVGSLVCIKLAGVVAKYGWRFIFLFHIIGSAVFVTAMLSVKADSRPRLPDASAGKAVSAPLLPLSLIGMAIGAGAIDTTAPIYFSFHLAQIGEGAPTRIALAIVPISLGCAASALLYALVRRHFSIAAIFVASFLCVGLVLIWLGLSRSYAEALAAASLLGVTAGLLAPNVATFAAVYGPRSHQARNIGIARGAFFASAPLAQSLLEPVSRHSGDGVVLSVLGGASLILMLWPMLLGKRMVAASDGPDP